MAPKAPKVTKTPKPKAAKNKSAARKAAPGDRAAGE
jgi:hypothetical protein